MPLYLSYVYAVRSIQQLSSRPIIAAWPQKKKTQKSSVQLPAASKQTKTSKPADLPVLWEEVERVASNLKIGKPTMAMACDVKIQHRKGSLPSHWSAA